MIKRGLTIVEILVVLAVVALIFALILPALLQARRNAHLSRCISNLHQVGQAIQMYRNDYENLFPSRMSLISGYVKSRDVFICPSDSTKGRGIIETFEGIPTRYQSILYALSNASRNNTSEPEFVAARILMEKDNVFGIAVCFLHGRRETQSDDPVLGDYMGKMLRLQVDSSVRPIYVDWVCTSERVGVIDGHLPGWFVFSDVKPCPSEIPPNAGLLECPPTRNVVPCP